MSRMTLVLGLALALCSACVARAADADAKGWNVRLAAAWISPTADSQDPFFDPDDTGGFAVGFGYRFGGRFALDFDYVQGTVEAGTSDLSGRISEFRFSSLSAAVNLHLAGGERWTLFVGPLVGFGSLGSERPLAGPFDKDYRILGADAGVDVAIGERGWTFGARLLYLDQDDAEESGPA